MLQTYKPYHTLKQSLFDEMKDLIDEYERKTATPEEVREMIAQWKKTCGLLFLEPGTNKLTKRARERMLGVRRAAIVQAFLDDMGE